MLFRDDGDARLRDYVESRKNNVDDEESETLGETFSNSGANYRDYLASPTGFEPVLSA